MPKVLIIGYGNPLRRDDGIGWEAAQALASLTHGLPIEVLPSHQLFPEMAEPISRSDLVIFIDACCDNSPGKLLFRTVTPERAFRNGFSHRVSPASLLASAEALYGKCPEAVLASVSGEDFGYGEGFSPAVQAVFPALLEQVKKVCGIDPGQADRPAGAAETTCHHQ